MLNELVFNAESSFNTVKGKFRRKEASQSWDVGSLVKVVLWRLNRGVGVYATRYTAASRSQSLPVFVENFFGSNGQR
jgi:hypothetical protein